MKKIILVLVALCLVQGCTKKPQDLKSPCVGIKGSPCGDRTPVNGHIKTVSA